MRLSFNSEGRRSGWGRGYDWSSWNTRRPCGPGERLRDGGLSLELSFSLSVDGGRRWGLKAALEVKLNSESMIVVSSGSRWLHVATVDGAFMIGENWGYLGGI